MTSSICRRHFQQRTAAKAAGAVSPGAAQRGEQFELHKAALWEARQTLKQIKSTEAKVAKKRELLPQFDSYVDGVLKGGKGAQDIVLVTMLIWHLDIGDITGALPLARYALQHNLDAPDRFSRDTASIIVEQTAEEAQRLLNNAHDDECPSIASELVTQLSQIESMTDGHDMHDQIRAKLFKALGYALRAANREEDALNKLTRALQLNERIGVKKDIERLTRSLKNADGEAITT